MDNNRSLCLSNIAIVHVHNVLSQQALLTGVCVSCPESPLHFLEKNILSIQTNQGIEIDW